MSKIQFNLNTFDTLPPSFEDKLAHLLFQYGTMSREDYDARLEFFLTGYGYKKWYLQRGNHPDYAWLNIQKNKDLPYFRCHVRKNVPMEEDGLYPNCAVNMSRYGHVLDMPRFSTESELSQSKPLSQVSISIFHPHGSDFAEIYHLKEGKKLTQGTLHTYASLYQFIYQTLQSQTDLAGAGVEELFSKIAREIESRTLPLGKELAQGLTPPFALVNVDVPLYWEDFKVNMCSQLCVE